MVMRRKAAARRDMTKIAKGLGAERGGKVPASGGYFGAAQLAADVEARFRVPSGGGRATDPAWTERRLLPLAPRTLKRLEEITVKVRAHGLRVEPMQLTALLIERAAERLSAEEAAELVGSKQRSRPRRLSTAGKTFIVRMAARAPKKRMKASAERLMNAHDKTLGKLSR